MSFFDIFKTVSPKSSYTSSSRVGSVSVTTRSLVESDWRTIKTLIQQGQPSQLRQALITADKTLDAVLKDVVSGESMSERLKNIGPKFTNKSVYQGLWDAHKMRNSVVHEAGYEPTHFMVKDAIEKIRAGLTGLGVSV